MTDLTLGITLKADGSGFVGEVKLSAEHLKKLGEAGKRAGDEGSKGTDALSSSLAKLKGFVISAVSAYVGFEGVKRLMGAVTREIMAAEKATANLNAVLRATGGTVGFTADQLSDLADELERATLFDDAEIKQAEAVLLTFRQVQGDTFREAISLATDLAALMGGDLQGAVLQLGKALEDPEQGLTALRRSGISFTDSQRDLIKSLVDAGDQAQAMRIILDQVAGQIGGVAKEQVMGLTGELNKLDDVWGDFLKDLGNASPLQDAVRLLADMAANAQAAWHAVLNPTGAEQLSGQLEELLDQRRQIEKKIAGLSEDSVAGWFDRVTGGEQKLAMYQQRLAEINDAITFMQAALSGARLPEAPATIPTLPPSGGSGGTSDADKVIAVLQFESEQLDRNAEAQQLYNALHQAGADINTTAGQTIQQLVASIQQKTSAQTLTDAAQEAGNATMEEGRKLMEELRTPTEVYADTIAHLGDLLAQKSIDQETFNRAVELADKTLEKATESTDTWKESWKSMGAVSTEALADILFEAKNVGDVLDGLWKQMLQIATQKLFAGPMNSVFDDILGGIFSGVAAAGGGGHPVMGAKGLVLDFGRLVPMAKGHVTTGPEVFPMANGGVGLRGEAGPEAVMPLARDGQGRLGVRARGGGDGGGDVTVIINNQSGQPATVKKQTAGDGRTIVEVMVGHLRGDIQNRGPLAQALEANYGGLSRRSR